MITSQIESLRLDGDVELADWESAGLLHPSLLRIAKVATIDEDLVDKVIGKPSSADQKSARHTFHHVFSAWVR